MSRFNGKLKKVGIIVVAPLVIIGLILAMRYRNARQGLKQITGDILRQVSSIRNPLNAKVTLKLYFESAHTGKLEAKEHQFPVVSAQIPPQGGTDKVGQEQLQNLVSEVLKALLAGPNTKELVATLPEGVTLRGVYFDADGVAYVDFDEQLVQRHPGGTQAELISVYSVVNTLCLNFPQIKRVKFLIGGKEVQTLAGHIDLRYSLSYRNL